MTETIQMPSGVTGPDAPEAPVSGARPEGIPEKFWDASKGVVRVEDLVKSYKELESGRSKPTDEDASTSESDGEEGESQPNSDEADLPAPSQLPENLSKFSTEYAEKGDLSEASYTELAELGYSKDVVDAYIDGVRRKAGASLPDEASVKSILDSVGGQESYDAMAAWARTNLPKEQLVSYDAAVSNKDTAQMAVEWLQARYKATEGFAPKVKLEGKSGAAPSGERYESMNELVKDQADPRYKSGDKAFHAYVDRKLANSNI